ncbi:biotin--[acetyl-CoA-carboxylase] ligase [Acholeplasma granularum]|uniref:biotin--[acetyl-CoA-carboxylase] ligase n=1 Tax=Acholeplasma granularum TaxID=264635 RepID=UPI00046F0B0D|nr:biotin--[acetyl-CoA-carboxylase] ligase [Acholeplasma granularum]
MAKIKLIEFKKIPSTNDYLKENYEKLPSFTFIRTDYQTKGRGQFERKWLSANAKNLLLSFMLKDIQMDQIIIIKEWVKSAIFSTLGSLGMDVYFKEPNDVYVNDKKLCGILMETKGSGNKFDYVIIGIGLNVNQIIFQNFKATSIFLETKKVQNVSGIMSKLITNLLESYF